MSELFRRIEPPPGGLARLRASLEKPERGLGPRLALAGALFAVPMVALLVVLRPSPRPPPFDAPGLVALGLEPAPSQPVAALGPDLAVERVSASPEVVFYRVASTGLASAP